MLLPFSPISLSFLALSLAASAGTSYADAPERWPAEYYRAYHLATAEANPAEAAKLYEALLDNSDLSDAQRATVRSRLADARERVIGTDLARLCPDTTVAFVHLRQPGALLERVAGMLGIPTEPVLPLLAERPVDANEVANASFDRPFIPQKFVLSPALVRWLKSFSGIAAAVTGVEQHGKHDPIPTGVAILDTGDTELLRGLIETAAQFAIPAEPIDGYPTLQFPHGVVAALTERMVIVGRPRLEVEAAVGRIKSPKDSLSQDAAFTRLAKGKAGATLFAYVNAQRAMAIAKPFITEDRDFAMFKTVADLDHLLGASFGIGAIDDGMGLDISVAMEDGHRNLAYNLMRLPPMSRRALECVPAKAAVVLGFALNPAVAQAVAGEARQKAKRSVTGLDVLREIFGNIEEVAAFVAPSEGGNKSVAGNGLGVPIPNGALIIASADADRSKALWNQLLTLPSIFMPDQAAAPKETELQGQPVTVFTLPEVGTIHVAQVNNCVIVSPKKEAISAVLRTAKSGASLLKDKAMQPVLSGIHPDTGVLLVAHAGRCLKLAGDFIPTDADGPPPFVVNMMTGSASKSLDSALFGMGLATGETELNLRAYVAGLPDLNQLLKQFGPMAKMAMRMSDGGMQSRRRAIAVAPEPSPAKSVTLPEGRRNAKASRDKKPLRFETAAPAARDNAKPSPAPRREPVATLDDDVL